MKYFFAAVLAVTLHVCVAIYGKAPLEGPIFSDGCDDVEAPAAVDLRCQGAALDTCGCLNFGVISRDPYYGCVLSGYVNDQKLPLVTLPGVIEPGADPGCQSDPKAAVPAGDLSSLLLRNACQSRLHHRRMLYLERCARCVSVILPALLRGARL